MMEMQAKLSDIRLYEYDEKGNCRADATLPGGERICGFRVMPGPGGGVMVHMPSVMGTTWRYPEIPWAEVRTQIRDVYRAAGVQVQTKEESPKAEPAVLGDIRLYEYDEKGNCRADATLPGGESICGFRVMPGPGGGVMVHMPSVMGTTWRYPEIPWAEVRTQIRNVYRAGAEKAKEPARAKEAPSEQEAEPALEVTLHGFDEKKNCLADIVLPESGTSVTGLKVMPGPGGGIMVHMPSWMHTTWSFPEIQWSTVRQTVTAVYLKKVQELPSAPETPAETPVETPAETPVEIPVETPVETPAETPAETPVETPAEAPEQREEQPFSPVTEPVFTFHTQMVKTEVLARVSIRATKRVITDVYAACINHDPASAYANMPLWMNKQWTVPEMTWEELSALVLQEFRRQFFRVPAPACREITVQFSSERHLHSCLVDIQLPTHRNPIRNFRLRHYGTESPRVSTPAWMGLWVNNSYPWNQLCRMIIEAYRRERGIEDPEPAPVTETPVTETPVTEASEVKSTPPAEEISDGAKTGDAPSDVVRTPTVRKTNELGRVLNAEHPTYVFAPRTVLRQKKVKTQNIAKLVEAMNSTHGGIGPFEINILILLEKLRYVTKPMLLDLIESGHVSVGYRSSINADKLNRIFERMQSFDLINLNRFVTLDENGSQCPEDPSRPGDPKLQILSLGKTGNTLLHELGKNPRSYNPFDIMQDGNTVKRYLVSNQWLTFWLYNYPNRLGQNYETARVIYRKGDEFTGARFYATVTLDSTTLVAEPVRRSEEFEIAERWAEFRAKVERLIGMFGNQDQLYDAKDEVVFPQRPILVLLCEDDDHIEEVRRTIGDILRANPEQEVWYTTDLRIFNRNMAGQRFFREDGGERLPVDIRALFGSDEDASEAEAPEAEAAPV
ncbi:MAG: hypothetical protein IJD06_08350 [Clostridia bacterium]|nr:hypothetical protein [Clostridia bacterium]